VRLCLCLLFQVDEDLAKINVDDPRYQRDDQDGFANGVRAVHSARVLVRVAVDGVVLQ